MRERHMLPAVDQTLAILTDVTAFSKLNCNSNFFQIPPHPFLHETDDIHSSHPSVAFVFAAYLRVCHQLVKYFKNGCPP
jgi:hypothetical protein